MHTRILVVALALAIVPPAFVPAAASFPGVAAVRHAAPPLVETVQRRGAAAHGGFVARGPRGGVVAGGRTAVVGRPGYRPVPARPVVAAPSWRRPAAYWWRPGAAVAAGAALGFVTAAAAATYVTAQPPAPGYCWYYTNTQRTQGFWDVCPR